MEMFVQQPLKVGTRCKLSDKVEILFWSDVYTCIQNPNILDNICTVCTHISLCSFMFYFTVLKTYILEPTLINQANRFTIISIFQGCCFT